jgi:hypothetical protein
MGQPKVPISVTDLKFSIEDIEDYLSAPPNPRFQVPYIPKLWKTKEGETVVVREAKKKEEAEVILNTLKQLIDHKYDKDFYHLVGVRTYSEILAWVQNRIKDSYVLVVTSEKGELLALVNHRFWDENVAISLHTITFRRKSNLGIMAYASKIEHAFDFVGVNEWWATFESPFGFRMGFRYVHQTKPWPQYQHELGGSRVYYLTKDMWESIVKPKLKARDLFGTRPVPEDLLKNTYPLRPPEKLEIEL